MQNKYSNYYDLRNKELNLTHLSLSSNSIIGMFGAVDLLQTIYNLTRLESLSLAINFVETLLSYERIATLHKLSSLKISNDFLDDSKAISLANEVVTFPNLQYIHVDSDKITNECKAKLTEIFAESDPLKRANFANPPRLVPTLVRLSSFAVQKNYKKESLGTKLPKELVDLVNKPRI